MQNQNDKRLTNPVGKEDQELRIEFGTIVFMIVGAFISWINMLMILYYLQGNFESIFVILAFLSVIFTTSIPGIEIGIKNMDGTYSNLRRASPVIEFLVAIFNAFVEIALIYMPFLAIPYLFGLIKSIDGST